MPKLSFGSLSPPMLKYPSRQWVVHGCTLYAGTEVKYGLCFPAALFVCFFFDSDSQVHRKCSARRTGSVMTV